MKLLAITVFLSYFSLFESLKYNSKNGLLPPRDSCGRNPSNGGLSKAAGPDDYPWMVFIPLKNRRPVPGENLRAAGVLISKRYFLMSKYALQYFMDYVYIGQHDTSQNVTCGESGCRPVHKIKAIYWVGDELEMAIVRLEEEVEFSEYVQPICLPFDDYPTAQPEETVYSSGWGRMYPGGPYALIKKKIIQSMITNEECEASGVIENAANERFICTKIEHNESTDIPCVEDEGAPIMYRTPENQWVLQGILPWLRKSCVVEGAVAGARMNDEAIEFILKHMYE